MKPALMAGLLAAVAVFLGAVFIGLANQSCNIDCYYGETPPWYLGWPGGALQAMVYALPAMLAAAAVAGGTAGLIARANRNHLAYLASLGQPHNESDSIAATLDSGEDLSDEEWWASQ